MHVLSLFVENELRLDLEGAFAAKWPQTLRTLSGETIQPKVEFSLVVHVSVRYWLLAPRRVFYKQVVYTQPPLYGICKFVGISSNGICS